MDTNNKNWENCDQEVFWGEIAPNSHVVQIYEDNDSFLSLLEGFITDGINAGDSIIVIATAEHLLNLYNRLNAASINVDALRNSDQYIMINSDEALASFIVDGWPDDKLFREFVSDLLKRARKNGRTVRAFGEMVATLWANGDCGATVRLEHLWDEFCKSETFCLYCAYPKSGFTQDSEVSMNNICCSHSVMIKEGIAKSQINYINVEQGSPDVGVS